MIAGAREAFARPPRVRSLAAVCLVVFAAGCAKSQAPPAPASTLRVGFGALRGLVPGAGQSEALNLLVSEGIVALANDGRVQPKLVKSWSTTPDGLTWTFRIRDGVTLHDGRPLTGDVLTKIMRAKLPDAMGRFFDDGMQIHAVSSDEINVRLTRRSNFLLESLDMTVADPDFGATGAYRLVSTDEGGAELLANPHYWGGKPAIDHIIFKTYDSLRSAWADMLRGEVDMLYEVGNDARESLDASRNIKVHTFQRRYAYEIILNVSHPSLKDSAVRRRLNSAIDRTALVADALGGQSRPENAPIWPPHWANRADLPKFIYQPVPLDHPLVLTCVVPDGSFERIALVVQRQLAQIGVELKFERVSLAEWRSRWSRGDFELLLGDFLRGPTIVRSAQFWYTGNEGNFGHYSNPGVDAALDAVNAAGDDAEYRRGIAAYQRALVDDPPSIFLAWSDRARAVSTRFEAYDEDGRDIINTLPLWRIGPISQPPLTH